MAVSISDGGTASFLKAQAVDHVDHATMQQFGAGIDQAAQIHSDGFRGLSILGADHGLGRVYTKFLIISYIRAR